MKTNRADGTGWDWCWADWRRDWMDATPNRYAYRCLPLTIVNQTGWLVKNPVGFTAIWDGNPGPGTIDFWFDADPHVLGAVDQQPVRRRDHHLEHAVPVPHPPAGLAAAGLGPANTFKATPTR